MDPKPWTASILGQRLWCNVYKSWKDRFRGFWNSISLLYWSNFHATFQSDLDLLQAYSTVPESVKAQLKGMKNISVTHGIIMVCLFLVVSMVKWMWSAPKVFDKAEDVWLSRCLLESLPPSVELATRLAWEMSLCHILSSFNKSDGFNQLGRKSRVSFVT